MPTASTGPMQLNELVDLSTKDPAAFRDIVDAWSLAGMAPASVEDEWSYRTRSVKTVQSDDGDGPVLINADFDVWVLRKQEANKSFRSTLLLGRAATNDIVLEHPSVSKLHARIRIDGDALWLSDAGSSNGTQLNTTSLRARDEKRIAHGDTLRIGDFILHVYGPGKLKGIVEKLRDG